MWNPYLGSSGYVFGHRSVLYEANFLIHSLSPFPSHFVQMWNLRKRKEMSFNAKS